MGRVFEPDNPSSLMLPIFLPSFVIITTYTGLLIYLVNPLKYKTPLQFFPSPPLCVVI